MKLEAFIVYYLSLFFKGYLQHPNTASMLVLFFS